MFNLNYYLYEKLFKILIATVALGFTLTAFNSPFDYLLLEGPDGEDIVVEGKPPHNYVWDCRAEGQPCVPIPVP